MTVPLWAALASIIVALIGPLQHVLEDHVQPVKGFLTAAGNCSIPLTLVVLGAYFYAPEGNAKGTELPHHSHESNNNNNDYSDQRDDDEARLDSNMTHRRNKRKSWASTYSELSLRSMLSLQGLRELSKKAGMNNESQTSKQRKTKGETTTVAIAVLSRMILTPLVLLPLMAISAKYDYPEVFDE